MEPAKFNLHTSDPIYYSFGYPTFTQSRLEASSKKSNITLMEEVRWLLNTYTNTILQHKNNIDESLYEVVKNTGFSCYHSTPKGHINICDAMLLADNDLRFTQGAADTFPATSTFFKGCIQIARKN